MAVASQGMLEDYYRLKKFDNLCMRLVWNQHHMVRLHIVLAGARSMKMDMDPFARDAMPYSGFFESRGNVLTGFGKDLNKANVADNNGFTKMADVRRTDR